MDDAKLNAELQRRVRELFGDGGASSDQTGTYQFESQRMNKTPGRQAAERRDAVFTLSSIATLCVIAGLIFTFLWNSGYVHDGALERRYYDMPTYGSNSYIEPFELLTKDFSVDKNVPEE